MHKCCVIVMQTTKLHKKIYAWFLYFCANDNGYNMLDQCAGNDWYHMLYQCADNHGYHMGIKCCIT